MREGAVHIERVHAGGPLPPGASHIGFEIGSPIYPGEMIMIRQQYREMIEGHPDALFMYGEPYIPVRKGSIVVQINGFEIIAEAREKLQKLIDDIVFNPVTHSARI